MVKKAPISVSAFLTKKMVENVLDKTNLSDFNLVLLPGFVQWDSLTLERKYSIPIRKGPEFASDLPAILKDLENFELSTDIPANRLLKLSGEAEYDRFMEERTNISKSNISSHTFYINETRSELMIGKGLPPPIIAEIVNCPRKNDEQILKKVKHYSESGADIIDIGCIANEPNPKRVKDIIKLIRNNSKILISIDSMNSDEIKAAIDSEIDMILSLDLGNYKKFIDIPKDIPIVILPTRIKEGYFPKDPEKRVDNLINLTKILQEKGFKKLIADPLLETPIAPGICNSLEAYFLYKKKTSSSEFSNLELPMFFGISNVVELMDVDSVGINGLMASMAIELDMGILFTVEHSTKLMNGVSELKESLKLNYVARCKKTPPINQGIEVFKAKGKTSQEIPMINEENAIFIDSIDLKYVPDERGYFKIYIDHYGKNIYVLHFNNKDKLDEILIGSNAESLSKKIIKMALTSDLSHANYIGRELKKAELYLSTGKPYIQDE